MLEIDIEKRIVNGVWEGYIGRVNRQSIRVFTGKRMSGVELTNFFASGSLDNTKLKVYGPDGPIYLTYESIDISSPGSVAAYSPRVFVEERTLERFIENFDEYVEGSSGVAKAAAQEALDAKEELTTDVGQAINELNEVKESNRKRYLDPVETVDERDSKYPTPENGDSVWVSGEGKMYRYNGTEWKVTNANDPSAIDMVSQQLADTSEQVQSVEATKMDKNTTDIAITQINKNRGKIDQTYLSDELLQQMAGNTPVNATPADKSITKEKIARKAVTREKTDFLEIKSDNIFDKTDIVGDSSFSNNTGLPSTSSSNNLSSYIEVAPARSYTFFRVTKVAFYDANQEFISPHQLDQVEVTTETPSNAAFMRVVVSNANLSVAQINEGAELKPYDEFKVGLKQWRLSDGDLAPGMVTTDKVQDNTITTRKRTPLGDLATVVVGASAPHPNIDTYNNKVAFNGTIWIYHRQNRYTFKDFEVPLDGAGAHQYVLFNIKTQTFRALRSSAEAEIDQNEILVMMINRRNTHEVINVFSTFKYTVDGKVLEDERVKSIVDDKIKNIPTHGDMAFSISLEDLNGWYNPSESQSYDIFDYDTTTANEIQQEFTNLANVHSRYITETNLGLDSSGDYSIYKYTLKPETVDVANLNKPFPKILIVSGLHAGSEKASIFSIYYFIKDLCENWQKNSLLEYLRHNVEFVIIPNANPWGFDGGDYRRNFNGVDLNRNFDYNWSLAGEGTGTYTGPHAFSEVEARYVRDMILENLDAMYFMDYHTNGSSGNTYGDLMWIPVPISPYNNYNVTNAARYTISKCTREFIKKYDQPNNEGLFGYISIAEGSRLSRSYAASKGIPASTFECFRKFPNQTEYHNSTAIKACTEFFGNFLVSLVKEFQVNNEKVLR